MKFTLKKSKIIPYSRVGMLYHIENDGTRYATSMVFYDYAKISKEDAFKCIAVAMVKHMIKASRKKHRIKGEGK